MRKTSIREDYKYQISDERWNEKAGILFNCIDVRYPGKMVHSRNL